MMVRELLDTRPEDFRIAAFDRSEAMVGQCAVRAEGAKNVIALVARAERMPFRDASFDVALAMGVLEYANARAALAEIARVLRPGGRLLATMLNPLSPYRIVEWHVYWPLLRALGRVEGLAAPSAGQAERCGRYRDPRISGAKLPRDSGGGGSEHEGRRLLRREHAGAADRPHRAPIGTRVAPAPRMHREPGTATALRHRQHGGRHPRAESWRTPAASRTNTRTG
jgi:SAM-dependent methyltransferase